MSQRRGNVRIHKGSIEISAYAGINPATGRKERLSERLPPSTPNREVNKRLTALLARADELAAIRRLRRRDGSHVALPELSKGRHERTVRHALEAWWKANGQHLAGAGTARQHIDVYLRPLWDVALGRLRTALDPDEAERDPDAVDLSAFYDELLTRGAVGRPGPDGKLTGRGRPLKPSSVKRIHATLHAALALAAGKGWLPTGNPATGIRFPADDVEAAIPEPGEMLRLVAFVAGGHIDTAAAALLVGNGPRPQEVAALTWTEVDFDTGRLSLAGRGVARVNTSPERWAVRSNPTDKRRRRTILLDQGTLDLLRRHRLRREEIALRCGLAISPRAFVFSDDADCASFMTPHSIGTSFTRWLDRAREAGLTVPAGMTLYDMRHYGITHALRRRVGVAEVARRFGTSQRMIHARYNHEIPGDDEAAAAAMAGVWGPAPTPLSGGAVIELRRE